MKPSRTATAFGTMMKAKRQPARKSGTAATTKSRATSFSFFVRPGTMKPQIWKSQTGEARMSPTKSDTVSWSAKASVMPAKLMLTTPLASDLASSLSGLMSASMIRS